MIAGKCSLFMSWSRCIVEILSIQSHKDQNGPLTNFSAMTVTIFPTWYQIQEAGNSFPTSNRSVEWPLLLCHWLSSLMLRLIKFIADLLKEVTAKDLDVAAMLLSRTSKLLAGLQQPTFLAGLQQPTSNLLQKSSKNGSGSNLFSTAPVLCINKHPDVIRGKVTSHPTDHLPFILNSFL